MSFQDDVAAIAEEHGMDVAIEYAAQAFDALGNGIPLGDVLRNLWRDIQKPVSDLTTAALSGADHELAYYTQEEPHVLR